ncbi:MAG TPA: GDSL-type esterase/lipase family protein, partial [Candidatus Methylacidiphilales bacterium]
VPADVASMSFFAGRGTIYDVAVSASQIPSGSGAGGTNNLADRYAARVKPHRPAANGGDGGPKAWLFVLAGVNDIYTGGKTAAQEIASLQSYVNTARADGFTVVLSPIMPVASAWGPSYEAVRLQVNAAIRNGTIASDVLVDYGTALPNPTDTSLYGDGLHPTALGHAIMARYLNNAMEAGGNLNGTAQSFFSEYLAVYNGALNLYPYATATPVTLSASGTTAVFSGPLAATGAAFSGPVSGASLALSGRLVSSPAATSSTSGYLVTGSTGDTANLNAGVLVYNNPPNVFGMDLGWKTGTNYYLRLFSEHSYPVAVAFYDASAGSPSSQSSFYTTAVFMPNGSAQFTASMEPVDNVTYPVVIKQTNTHGASAIAFNDENGNGMGVFGNFSSSSIWPNRWEWIAANPVELRDGSHNLYGYFDPANKKFRFGDGTAPSDVVESTGNVSCAVAGGTLKVKSGTNALAGTVTLSSGAATIASSAIDANTVIVLSLKTSSGTPGTFAPRTSVAAGSATVTGNAGDNSTYNWIGLKVN